MIPGNHLRDNLFMTPTGKGKSMKHNAKADMIVDLQYGSTGKGLIAGYLAKHRGYDTIINANMPNAGHTFIDKDGRKWIHKVLPNGIVGPEVKQVMLGPGSIFDPERLRQELEDSRDIMDGITFRIHPAACILLPGHKEKEQDNLSHIASTMQGSSEAMMDKIRRDNLDSPLVQDNIGTMAASGLYKYICHPNEWGMMLRKAKSILIEAAQGYSLGINAGFWPYCTSRDCTPARFLADCAVPHTMLRQVIGSCRTYPIRVGNTSDGHSGDHYNDQEEITWDAIGIEPELTTVTGRERRIFTFSVSQIEDAIFACQPDAIFLNFANYVGQEKIGRYIEDIEGALFNFGPSGSDVRYLGWGPSEVDIQRV